MKTAFKQSLKAKAHALKPVCFLGQKALTPALLAEIDVALTAHELIKVKIHKRPKEEIKAFSDTITETLNATLIQIIGHVLVLYRAHEKH